MDKFKEKRHDMVEFQIKAREVTNEDVLAAMRKVPRHLFVPKKLENLAYADVALEIKSGQTISQPYIVGLMTSLANPTKKKKALEIGTGTGYQTALLAELCHQVITIEIDKESHLSAKKRLNALKYKNVECILGNGYEGYPTLAPYDLIVVTASPKEIPQPLIDQLAPHGRMVIPVGTDNQQLVLVTKDKSGDVAVTDVISVRFVPMIH